MDKLGTESLNHLEAVGPPLSEENLEHVKPEAESQNPNHAPFTQAEEAAVRRKVDMFLMPLMIFEYGLLIADKNAFAAAGVVGMNQALGLIYTVTNPDGTVTTDSGRYSRCSMVFWVGFALGAYPLMALAQRFPIARTSGVYVMVWGAILLATIGVKDYNGMMAQRFFLGFFESGVSPVFQFMCGTFYRKNEQSARVALWCGGGIVTGGFCYFINYGLVGIKSNAIAEWKIIFIFWSMVTILVGLAAFFIMPDSPATAKWFTERERFIAVERLRENQDSLKDKHFKKEQMWEAVTDVKVWLQGLLIFSVIIVNGLGTTFMPVIVKSLGFDARRTLLLSCPVSFLSGFSAILGGFICQRYKNMRAYMIIFWELTCLIGIIMLLVIPKTNVAGSLAGLYLAGQYGGALALCLGLVPSNIAGSTKRSLASGVFFVLYCLGNIGGPLVFLPTAAPAYRVTFVALIICNVAAILLALVYRWMLARENKRRNSLGSVAQEDRAFMDLTDKQNLSFRFAY